MISYPKIPGPFKRHPNNMIDRFRYSSEEIAALAPTQWTWTEKIDGTNLRIHWDGHKPIFGGRTGNAQIRVDLLTYLQETFREELFEQQFGNDPVTLFGEGVGPKIQAGSGRYADTPSIILFDAYCGGLWLRYPDVAITAANFGIRVTPHVGSFGLFAAVAGIEDGLPSHFHPGTVEGIVGVAPHALLDRRGNRIQVKVKTVDFQEKS